MIVKTPIIPESTTFVGDRNSKEISYKDVAFFLATGFFLDDTTFYKNQKCLKPGAVYEVGINGAAEFQKHHFTWHYSPRDISFNEAVDEFAHLMDTIAAEKLKNRKVILPLSGGLDSRSLATTVKGWENVHAYSYQFQDSFNETKYGKAIADACQWNFSDLSVNKGYLWNVIEQLAAINECYSDFTHPRQMAFFDDYSKMGDVFYLGHWGDVLFNDMGVSESDDFDQLVSILKKKIIKKGGLELAKAMWEAWGLSGDFEQELTNQLSDLLATIKIDNNNARIRAFKSLYWAPRWTSVNLNVFKAVGDMVLPYYEDRMCQFICSIPETYLAKRKIQIEYIKRFSPELAQIPWQSFEPLNLYNYQNYFSKKNLPNRLIRKAKSVSANAFGKRNKVTRNWEIQFLGKQNEKEFTKWLFGNDKFKDFVPTDIVESFYEKFKTQDSVYYSHSVSMLLTLSLFSKQNANGKKSSIHA